MIKKRSVDLQNERNLTMNPEGCQFGSLLSMGEKNARKPFKFYIIKLGRFLKRHLSQSQFAFVNKSYVAVMNLFSKEKKFSVKPTGDDQKQTVTNENRQPLKAGDMVRVRTMEEIEATLDRNGKTKGCGFMKAQREYCGTVQSVFKSMERFVEERDFKVKKCKGLVLLEGVMCEGNEIYGRCDRSCLIFWREEWLEKI